MCIRDRTLPFLIQDAMFQDAVLYSGVAHNQSVGFGTFWFCLLYTSDAADERSSVDLGGRRIIKKKKNRCRSSRRRHRTKRQKNKNE